MALLELHNLRAGYDGNAVLQDISLAVEPGECLAVLGANGAGKTTLLRSIAGLVRPSAGRIVFDGQDISHLPAHEIAQLGIALIPEGRLLFPEHSVRENLELGAYQHLRAGKQAVFQKALGEVCEMFPIIRERLAQPAGELSGGEQQMVAVARALMSRPRLLLLDEPSLGLAPKIVLDLFRVFDNLRSWGLTMLVAEQMTRIALAHSQRAAVLQRGQLVLAGASEKLQGELQVHAAYLGGTLAGGTNGLTNKAAP